MNVRDQAPGKLETIRPRGLVEYQTYVRQRPDDVKRRRLRGRDIIDFLRTEQKRQYYNTNVVTAPHFEWRGT